MTLLGASFLLDPSGTLLATMAIAAASLLPAAAAGPSAAVPSAAHEAEARKAAEALRAKHGASEGARIDRGIAQVLRLWREGDGSPEALRELLEASFLPAGAELDATFGRLEFAFERKSERQNAGVLRRR